MITGLEEHRELSWNFFGEAMAASPNTLRAVKAKY
jgi:hypothetical protein